MRLIKSIKIPWSLTSTKLFRKWKARVTNSKMASLFLWANYLDISKN